MGLGGEMSISNSNAEVQVTVEDKLQETLAQNHRLAEMNRILTDENERLKSGLLNIQQNLATSVETNQGTLDECRTVNAALKDLLKDAASIKDDAQSISDGAEASQNQLSKLAEERDQIKSLIREIVGISEESKVLALNATIEAARAGEVGKGFAVVANEVKELSEKTREATEKIGHALHKIGKSATAVENDMKAFFERTFTINSTIEEFYQLLRVTTDSNTSTMANIHSTNDQIFVSLAKLDHIIWKVNTYLSVLHQKECLQFVDHHNCRLGKWFYEGDGYRSFSHLSSYKELERPHALTHSGTKEVLEQLDTEPQNLETVVKGLRIMEEGSQGVFDGLDSLLQEKRSTHDYTKGYEID